MNRKAFIARASVAITFVFGMATLSIAVRDVAIDHARTTVKQELSGLSFPRYERQSVVYQVNEAGGWFGSGYLGLLGSLANHVKAVGPTNIDLRIVLQGRGIDLLRRPTGTMRDKIDRLRAQGVRFLVCRNTLIDSATAPSDLYGVKVTDLVPAGVAEIASLQAKGFVYLRL